MTLEQYHAIAMGGSPENMWGKIDKCVVGQRVKYGCMDILGWQDQLQHMMGVFLGQYYPTIHLGAQ